MAAFPTEDGSLGVPFVVNRTHQVSEYIQAFLAAGLVVTACVEPLVTEDMLKTYPTYPAYPDATREAYVDLPYVLIWQLQR